MNKNNLLFTPPRTHTLSTKMDDGVRVLQNQFPFSHIIIYDRLYHWRIPNNGVYSTFEAEFPCSNKLLLVHFCLLFIIIELHYRAYKHTYRYILSSAFYLFLSRFVMHFDFIFLIISIMNR